MAPELTSVVGHPAGIIELLALVTRVSEVKCLVLTPMEERFFSGLEAAFRQMPLDFPQLGGLRKG